MLKHVLLAVCLSMLLQIEFAEAGPRERIGFNDDWRFFLGDAPEAGKVPLASVRKWLGESGRSLTTQPSTQPTTMADVPTDWSFASTAFDDSSWRPLRLPHDWAIEGPFVQALPGETGKRPFAGVAWYRKTFTLDAADAGRDISIDFDGAMSHAMVFINGKFAGGWPYGYTSFRIDASAVLRPGRNLIAVRLQNPQDSSRWYPGAGIYRNVWLNKASPIHIAQWGVEITTPQVSDEKAIVQTKVTLTNGLPASADISTSVELFELDADGRLGQHALPSGTTTIKPIAAGSTDTVTLDTTYILQPKRWSTQTPNRYLARVRLEQNGKVIDEYDQPFGVRTIAFTAENGFQLNGQRVPLNGVCEHHDLGALGTAFNTRAMQRKLEILKSMGVNALRTSHNPPSPEVLDVCDRLGIVVIDESFDCWQAGKTRNDYGRLFADWSERDLRALVRRDRNHPSVIAWSIGNEVLEQGKAQGATIETGVPMGQRLSAIVKQEDPTRPTAIAFDHPASGFNGMNTTADIMGFNYKPMLYARFHQQSPQQPYIGSETASTISSRGEYFFPVSDKKGDGRADFQMSSYDLYAPGWATPPDVEFAGQEKNPSVAGEFVWTGFDYLGEPTPYSRDSTNLLNFSDPAEKARMQAQMQEMGRITVPSRSSYFGIIDLAGFPKDRFYLYQAHWRRDLPMAHILPHWTWPDRLGQVTPVHVYTSGDEAELFLNGRSLGRKKKEPFTYRLRWDDVKYEPGELKVVAYRNGKQWADAVQRTAGDASRLTLTADRDTIRGDGDDLSFVTATITDDHSVTVPRASTAIQFSIEGPGEIVATDNGNAIDHASFQSTERRAYNGLALAIVRFRPGSHGSLKLTASGPGLQTATITIQTPAAVR